MTDELREQIEELIESAEDQLEELRAALTRGDFHQARAAAKAVLEATEKVKALIPGPGGDPA